MQRHPFAEILIAIAEGKEVEYKYMYNWYTFDYTADDFPGVQKGCEWRIKPKIVKQKVWINIYDNCTSGILHESKEKADENASPTRIACVEVDFEYVPGQGLE